MIPIPPSTNPAEAVQFYKAVKDNLKIRCMHHESWHTHKRDPSVCWICDYIEITTILVNEIERFISKSALDIDEQSLDSEVISEDVEEIVNYNTDDK